MEDRATYTVPAHEHYVRAACLRPAGEGWEVPSREEVLYALRRAGLDDPRSAADWLQESRKEINRWTTGAAPVRYACWVLICRRAKLGYEAM